MGNRLTATTVAQGEVVGLLSPVTTRHWSGAPPATIEMPAARLMEW